MHDDCVSDTVAGVAERIGAVRGATVSLLAAAPRARCASAIA
jgi:hypothetical protein